MFEPNAASQFDQPGGDKPNRGPPPARYVSCSIKILTYQRSLCWTTYCSGTLSLTSTSQCNCLEDWAPVDETTRVSVDETWCGFVRAVIWIDNLLIDRYHKSPNTPVPCPTIYHSGQKCAHFCSKWCIVGYRTGAVWDLRIWSVTHNQLASFIQLILWGLVMTHGSDKSLPEPGLTFN